MRHSSMDVVMELHKESWIGTRAAAGGLYVPAAFTSPVLTRALRACQPLRGLITNELWSTQTLVS